MQGLFVKVNEDLFDLVINNGLTFLDVKVYSYLLSLIDKNNRVERILQKEIAKVIRSTQSSVSKSLIKLERYGLIERSRESYLLLGVEVI